MARLAPLLPILLLLAGEARAAGSAELPLPPQLEPNVRFWTRIYTEVDGHAGLIHDSVELDVVYAQLKWPEGLSRRSRERRVEDRKKEIRAALRKLGKGQRTNLSAEEARVLAAWPEGTSSETFRRAASHVRYQVGQADKFRAGIGRSGRWMAHIEDVLTEHGVPRALVALPHVESSFNPRAYSRVGAAGIWQFTRSTGRRYMRVDHVVDERMDPWKATVGAARLLRDNYRRLEAWPLAITAYNHGVSGVARGARKVGSSDIGVIARRYQSRTFGFASRNFYSEFLAAWAIHQNPTRYFGPVIPEPPVDYAVVEMDAYYPATSLGRAFGIDLDLLREHNLALRSSVWNGAKLVPKGYELRIPRRELKQPAETLLAAVPEGQRLAHQKRDRYHKVRRGESLSVIARRYGVSQSELVAINNLRSRHRIRAGQVLRLPDDGSAPVMVARAEPPADGVYPVRRGDNLSVIAARFGVSVPQLVEWNRLRNRNRLSIGQRLRVSAPAEAPATLVASADEAAASDARVLPVDPATPAEPEAKLAVASRSRPPAPAPVPEAGGEPPEDAPADVPAAEESWTGASGSGAVVAVARENEVSVPDPSNYAVTASGRVTVQAEETLGHYAEWLEVSASRLRRLNGMRYGTPLVIGRQKKLDFSRVTPEVFEQRRLQYHRMLQEEFFEAWTVTGTTTHSLRRGDSLWYLANRKYKVPLWLLRQYNPDVDFGSLPAGTPMVIPLLEPRAGGNTLPAAS